MAVESAYKTLDEFTDDMDRIVRKNSNGTVDGAAIVEELTHHFERLLSNMDWLDDEFRNVPEGRMASYMLAKAPDDSWSIVSTIWAPGTGTTVHDHLIWGLIGVWDGIERERRYVRTDDRSDPKRATLKEIDDAYNEPISISQLVPPDDDYHKIVIEHDQTARSIHVYGG